MKIYKGKSRIVFVFSKIAIKLPIIRFIKAFKIAKYWIKRRIFWQSIYEYNYYTYSTVQIFLLLGIMENWNEYRFYKETKSIFLVPTYFSLLGLVNFQKIGKPFYMNEELFWKRLYHITQGKIFDDPHHFLDQKNFSKTDDRLQMLDYGNHKCFRVIREYGDKIFEEFEFV